MECPKGINFLIVDDYEVVRVSVKKDLMQLGMTGELFEAADGQEALNIFSEKMGTATHIDFIICDMVMPEVSGLEFLNDIREKMGLKDLPFLMLTAERDRDTVVQCAKSGTSNYIVKPWTAETLGEKIDSCWNKHHS